MSDRELITLNEKTNCAELVAKLVLDYFHVAPDEQPLHLLKGMGRGLQIGSLCGGISGGLFAMNYLLQLYGANDTEIGDAHEEFQRSFLSKFSKANCSDIIELHFGQEDFDDRQERFCGNLLDETTNEAVEIINLVASLINPISTSMNSH